MSTKGGKGRTETKQRKQLQLGSAKWLLSFKLRKTKENQTGLDGLVSRSVDAHAYDCSIVYTEASRGVMKPHEVTNAKPTHHRWGLLLLDSNQRLDSSSSMTFSSHIQLNSSEKHLLFQTLMLTSLTSENLSPSIPSGTKLLTRAHQGRKVQVVLG